MAFEDPIDKKLNVLRALGTDPTDEEIAEAFANMPPIPRLKRNAAKCKSCGDIVESTHRHDFVTCSCGTISVDGGLAYLRRSWSSPEGLDFDEVAEELSEYED